MSTDERDTHFQGFAKLLWHEIRKTSFDSPGFSEYPQLERHLQLLIAQRAYDLLDHASQYVMTCPEDVPDLDAWPKP